MTSEPIPHPTVLASIPDASWLPPGGRADIVYAPGSPAPEPTCLVRLVIRRADEIFCVPRPDGRIDLPTLAVDTDVDTSLDEVCRTVLGRPVDRSLLGYVRNVVPTDTTDYPWPLPLAHFTVWRTASAVPTVDGVWRSLGDPGELTDRHWWALVAHTLRR